MSSEPPNGGVFADKDFHEVALLAVHGLPNDASKGAIMRVVRERTRQAFREVACWAWPQSGLRAGTKWNTSYRVVLQWRNDGVKRVPRQGGPVMEGENRDDRVVAVEDEDAGDTVYDEH